MLSERIQDIYNKENIKVRRIDFIDEQLDGIIIGNTVYESGRLETAHEQNVLRSHELMHYKTNPYNLMDADKITQAKYERLAVRDTAQMLCPIDALIRLYFEYKRTPDEIAEELEITPKYVCSVLKYYAQAYGNTCRYKNYHIRFIPLEIRCEKKERRFLPSKQSYRR